MMEEGSTILNCNILFLLFLLGAQKVASFRSCVDGAALRATMKHYIHDEISKLQGVEVAEGPKLLLDWQRIKEPEEAKEDEEDDVQGVADYGAEYPTGAALSNDSWGAAADPSWSAEGAAVLPVAATSAAADWQQAPTPIAPEEAAGWVEGQAPVEAAALEIQAQGWD